MTSDPYDLGGTFRGRLRGRDVAEGGAEARVSVNPEGLQAQAGDLVVDLAFRGMKVRRDDGGALVCTSGGRSVSCLDPEFERALETAGGNDLNDQLARLEGQRATTPVQHRVTCSLTLVAFVAFLWFLPAMFRGCTNEVAENIPYTADEQLGEFANEQIDADREVIEDPLVIGAIQLMVNRLAPHTYIPEHPNVRVHFNVRVVESDIVNAYALPGGFITVYTGLIAEAATPEQVAGVLAHEIAHVTERHGIKRLVDKVALQAVLLAASGDMSSSGSELVALFSLAAENAYSRDMESDADDEGVRLLVDANLDPIAMAEFFDLLRSKYGDTAKELSWLSTHPSHEDRIESIRAQAKVEQAARGAREWETFDLDWEAVQAALEE